MLRRLLAAALIWAMAAEAGAACRQALALGLDVSGSVDSREYRLQLDGLAGALTRAEVAAAVLAMPDAPVRILVYEWAGPGQRRVLVPWTEIADAGALAAVADSLRETGRVAMDPGTALGEAMIYGAEALGAQPDCWRRTLDVSGDGQSNMGPRPRDVRTDARFGDATINALVVTPPPPGTEHRPDTAISSLAEYFRIEVIRGPDAFVEVARGYADFEEAMARKLFRELQTLAIGALEEAETGGK